MKAAAAKYPVHGPDARRHLRRLGRRAERARGAALPRRLLQGRPSPTAAATTTAWTRSGGTSSGWAGRSARTTPRSRTSTNAHKLQGKLLLIVGELDRNVDPASTMQVVNALIKADKDFELRRLPRRRPRRRRAAATASAAGATSSSGTCSASSRRTGTPAMLRERTLSLLQF